MNRNYKYGTKSLSKISTVKPEMQQLCHEALRIANSRKMHCPDFGISHGYRTTEEQYDLYCKGRFGSTGGIVTNCDGIEKKSVHQFGYAIDFFPIVDGKYNSEPANLALVATCFFEAASNLGLSIDWGGSFRSISDGFHVEIVMV